MSNIEIIRLNKGDEIINEIINFCKGRNITSAWFSGLGAAENAEICIYKLKNKKYIKKNLNEPLEIANITGNVAMKDGEIVVHCHVTLADMNLSAWAGHLNKAEVGATCEIIIQNIDINLLRKHDAEIGLNLLDL